MPKSRPNQIDVFIGRRMRERRRELGLTQSDVGEALNITFQQLQKYERGTSRIAASMLLELSRQFCVPFTYFVTEPSVAQNAGTLTALQHGWTCRRFTIQYGQLPEGRKSG